MPGLTLAHGSGRFAQEDIQPNNKSRDRVGQGEKREIPVNGRARFRIRLQNWQAP
jgi:hypothetical protein